MVLQLSFVKEYFLLAIILGWESTFSKNAMLLMTYKLWPLNLILNSAAGVTHLFLNVFGLQFLFKFRKRRHLDMAHNLQCLCKEAEFQGHGIFAW